MTYFDSWDDPLDPKTMEQFPDHLLPSTEALDSFGSQSSFADVLSDSRRSMQCARAMGSRSLVGSGPFSVDFWEKECS